MTALTLVPPPEAGTVERWAWDYVASTSLATKLDPPPPPDRWCEGRDPQRMSAPGRPPELCAVARAAKKRGLGSPRGRAQALHKFWHHELQAAELMAWALLAFPDVPREFSRGLLRILLDETRHMRMYAAQIQQLGFGIGDFVVRDWFWERVPGCRDPASFVAVMGLGLESANLDHAASFAAAFREAGDDASARVQEIVGLEEIAHVRFGVRWFAELTRIRNHSAASAGAGDAGQLDFTTWREALPEPLSPLLMRGSPLRRDARARAGQPEAFLDELERWTPTPLCNASDAPGS